jgi:hypothetical protein
MVPPWSGFRASSIGAIVLPAQGLGYMEPIVVHELKIEGVWHGADQATPFPPQ